MRPLFTVDGVLLGGGFFASGPIGLGIAGISIYRGYQSDSKLGVISGVTGIVSHLPVLKNASTGVEAMKALSGQASKATGVWDYASAHGR